MISCKPLTVFSFFFEPHSAADSKMASEGKAHHLSNLRLIVILLEVDLCNRNGANL